MNKLIAYRAISLSDGEITLECSNGQSITTSDAYTMLHFLVASAPEAQLSTPRVVWNLAEFVFCIKRVLPDFAVQMLEGENRRAVWEDEHRYRIFLMPGKFFSPNIDHQEATFFELDQYFPDDRVMESIEDVETAAEELVAAFASLGVRRIDNLKSPVAVVESSGVMQAAFKALPLPSDIPGGVKEYATLSDTWGAWSSAYQVGYWPEGTAYSYDIASCYPSIATKLFSLYGADYKYSKKMLDGAHWGFVKGTLFINPDHPLAWCSPIVAPVGNDMVANPIGKVKGVFTLGQVKYIERHGMGKFELTDGWFIFLKSGVRPLEPVMTALFKQRAAGGLLSQIVKRVLDGLIGRLGEYHSNEPTAACNPVYHSLIRNTASLLVGEFIIKNSITQEELIHVNTDGFHTTRKLDLPETAGIGKWRSDPPGQLIVLSPELILEGERCNPLLDAIKRDKKGVSYDLDGKSINLMSLAVEQDRHFPQYPTSGSELLRKRFSSQPIV